VAAARPPAARKPAPRPEATTAKSWKMKMAVGTSAAQALALAAAAAPCNATLAARCGSSARCLLRPAVWRTKHRAFRTKLADRARRKGNSGDLRGERDMSSELTTKAPTPQGLSRIFAQPLYSGPWPSCSLHPRFNSRGCQGARVRRAATLVKRQSRRPILPVTLRVVIQRKFDPTKKNPQRFQI
jgi:hypothetical protein